MPYKKLTIPDPCQQKWHQMKANGEGRHCQSCNTTIVDFSELSDEELIKVLQTGKYHCGKFNEDQMGIMLYVEEKQKERKKYWNSVAAAIVAGVLQVSSGFGQTDNQPYKQKLYPRSIAIDKYFKTDSEVPSTPKSKEKKDPSIKTQEKKDKITFIFQNEKHKTAMKGVVISIKELSFSGTSNGDGEIVLELNPTIDQDQIITIEIQDNIYKTGRGKRGYHGRTLFLELNKLVNDEKVIYLHVKSGRKHWGRREVLGRMYFR